MSNAVYPTLPGLTFDNTRTPTWSTTIKGAVSLREYRSANASYPVYHYKLTYALLRQTGNFAEMAALAGFFNARNGSFDSFLFFDADDSSVVGQVFGAGNASTVQFQLVRTFGGYVEPVFDVNGPIQVYVAGTLKTAGTDYSVGTTGLVTFAVAPAASASITWTGGYYRRVRFAQDSAEFVQFLRLMWSAKTIELVSCKP